MFSGKKTGIKMRQQLADQQIDKLITNKDRLKYLLNYGRLAPSTHNTQPWKIAITDNQIKLYADLSKKIPEADPTGRDMFMSLGAFIQNIELACQAHQLTTDVVVDSSTGDDQIASITVLGLESLTAPAQPKLLEDIRNRQNFRGFFEGSLDQASVDKIILSSNSAQATASVYFDQSIRNPLADLTVQGLRTAYGRPEFRQEISSYINNNLSPKRYGLHGYSLRMSLPLSFIIPKVMKRKDIGAKLAALNKKSFDTAPAVVVLSGVDTVEGWVECGRVLELIMVRLAGEGILSSIYAAAIETDELRPQVANIIGLQQPMQPQLLFCIGKSDQTLPYSVRKDLSEVML